MAFRITHDFLSRKGEAGHAGGVTGPRTIQDDTLARLEDGEGVVFRLLDDDGILYYKGRYISDEEREDYEQEGEFQPLDCFGTPDSGCTAIEYKNAADEWEAL